MFNAHLGQSREKIIAVADVGGGRAAIAVIAVKKGVPARVITTQSSILSFADRSEGAKKSGIAAQVAAAGEKIQKAYAPHLQRGLAHVSELYVILHAPWVLSKTRRAHTILREETRITDRAISSVAENILASEPDFDRKNLIFEATVMRTELNGYPCAQPIGKHAESLTVYALLSEGTMEMRSEITSSLQKIFPHISPVFRSATRATITVLHEVMGEEKDYFVVNMIGDVTTLTAVRDGVVAEHEIVPEGMHTLIKRIANSGMPEETLSMMRMLAQDQCSDPACDSIRAAITRSEPELVRAFGESIGKCAAERRLPNTLVLVAHPDLSLWLSKFFSRIDFAQFTLTTQPFTVRTLQSKDFASFVQLDDGVVLDSELALACGLVHIERTHP